MTDWIWEYLPNADQVVGGLPPEVKAAVEGLAERLGDAATVKYIGDLPAESGGIFPILNHAEGRIILWYLEHPDVKVVYIARVQYWPPKTEPR